MPKSMYNIIKKQNGERFAKTIRAHHSGIFDIPHLDKIVKYAGRDATPLLDYLNHLLTQKIQKKGENAQNPLELLDKAGYNAYYADSLQKQNAIRKYFEPTEELCTFRDAARFKNYHIINAVKKNVDTIKRGDFKTPDREDAYAKSVISIQVLKSGGFISIKNRYNHTVQNPDNTFNSNPDNIIEGLSDAIEQHFNIRLYTGKPNLGDNFIIVDGQIVNYTEEWENTYFGKNFYLRDGVIYDINPDSQIMFNTYILDIKTRSVIDILENKNDPFTCHLEEEIKNAYNLHIKKTNKHTCLYGDGHQILKIDPNGVLQELCLEKAIHIQSNFLSSPTNFNVNLKKISLSNTLSIGNYFLYLNEGITDLELPKVKSIGNDFMLSNLKIETANLPQAIRIGNFFMYSNNSLKKINISKVEQIGDGFLGQNNSLQELNIPQAKVIGKMFLESNKMLKNLTISPNVPVRPYFLAKHPLKHQFIKKHILSFVFRTIQNNQTEHSIE